MTHILPLRELNLLLPSDKDSAFDDWDALDEDKNTSYPEEWLILFEAFS